MPPKITLSRGLRDRMKLAEVLEEVFGGLSREIAARRAELLVPELRQGETMPDAELEHQLYLRLLGRRLEEAVEVEQDYRREAIELKALNRDRDQATAELNRQLGGLRQLVDLARGRGASATFLGLKGRTERRQQGIFRQAGEVLARLGGLEPSGSELSAVANDPAAWQGMIEPAYCRLEDLRREISVQEKRLEGLLIAKTKIFALFDDTARGLVRIAEGQCRLVGEDDLAKRIRRFSRKRTKSGPKPKKQAKGKKAKSKKAKSKKAKSKKAKTVGKAKKRRSLASARVA